MGAGRARTNPSKSPQIEVETNISGAWRLTWSTPVCFMHNKMEMRQQARSSQRASNINEDFELECERRSQKYGSCDVQKITGEA